MAGAGAFVVVVVGFVVVVVGLGVVVVAPEICICCPTVCFPLTSSSSNCLVDGTPAGLLRPGCP